MNRFLAIGLLLVGVSLPMSGAGALIPILGLLIAAMAPNVFLAGLAMIVFSVVRGLVKHVPAAVATTALITILLGVNTRLPSVISDALDRNELRVVRPLSGAVGQPIHITASTAELWGRWFPYRSVTPACYGTGCFMTRGFGGAYTGLSGDYWRENIVDTVLEAGFSKASINEKAPRVEISEVRDGDILSVKIEMRDANGITLANFNGQYRNGYPLETKDDGNGGEVDYPIGAAQYLLHGNSVSRWLSRAARPTVEPPLQAFLKAASSLSHTQAQPGNATPVVLEILSEKLYEPIWIIKNHDDGTAKWSDLAFDKTRRDRCAQLLKPEKEGTPLMQGWLLFKADPSGRKKVRSTFEVLCEAEALWFFDSAAERGKVILTKYTAAGDLVYRISFDEPAPINGFAGDIMRPTFKEQAGYLNFDWWDSNRSGADRHIKRSMKVRLAEPRPAAS